MKKDKYMLDNDLINRILKSQKRIKENFEFIENIKYVIYRERWKLEQFANKYCLNEYEKEVLDQYLKRTEKLALELIVVKDDLWTPDLEQEQLILLHQEKLREFVKKNTKNE